MDWFGFLGTISGVATAVFAGYGVYLLIVERLERIKAEFVFSERPRFVKTGEEWRAIEDASQPIMIHIAAKIYNGTSYPARVETMRAFGVPLLMMESYNKDRVRRWDGTGIERDVDEVVQPGKSVEFGLGVEVDWLALQSSRSQPSPNGRTTSALLEASVIIDRRSLVIRKLSRTDMTAIKAETIEKNAAKAAQK